MTRRVVSLRVKPEGTLARGELSDNPVTDVRSAGEEPEATFRGFEQNGVLEEVRVDAEATIRGILPDPLR